MCVRDTHAGDKISPNPILAPIFFMVFVTIATYARALTRARGHTHAHTHTLTHTHTHTHTHTGS